MQNPQAFSTARLLLRPVIVEDASDLYTIYSDPQAMRYMETPPHTNPAETQARIVDLMAKDTCYWSICLKETGKVIGIIGYLGNIGIPGMGYFLGSAWWRQGYMTEAIQPALEYGFTRLFLDRVELWIHQDNQASQRLAARSGFTRRGHFRMRYNHQPEPHDMLVYGLYRHEWDRAFPAAAFTSYTAQPILAAEDVKATAEYYRDVLGFTIEFFYGTPPVHASISCAEWTAEGARIQITHNPALPSMSRALSIYIFAGPDIETRYQLYRSRGVEIVSPLALQPWGLLEFEIRDCNGYVIRFGTPG